MFESKEKWEVRATGNHEIKYCTGTKTKKNCTSLDMITGHDSISYVWLFFFFFTFIYDIINLANLLLSVLLDLKYIKL